MYKLPDWRIFTKSTKLLLVVFSISFINNAAAQSLWKFEKATPLLDNHHANQLALSGKLSAPELVPGYKGTGLRTDGYATYLSKKLPFSQTGYKNVNGWFALETYPTDTAGFIALGTKTGNFISVCVNRFGQVVLGVNTGDTVKYYGSGIVVPKFKWLNVSLSLSGHHVEFSVNGKKANTHELPASFLTSTLDSLVIGRDWRTKMVNIFPVTFINGIIDEISYTDKKSILSLAVDHHSHSDPVLAVPERRFKDDFTRSKYHLLPAANWTNETHGLLYYKGVYHIFNQKNGANLFLGQINWGHFTSPDLIHWTEQKPALSPEQGYDQNGIWSGCAVIGNDGKPAIIYTGGGESTFGMCLASPVDENLINWKKYAGNPVISSVPSEFTRKDFHDPYVWKESGTWYMIIGFGLESREQKKGTVLLYKSSDLKHWTYLHPLFSGDPDHDDSGVFWEMPVFWKMNNKYVLLVNKVPDRAKPAVALYWVGDFKNEVFVPDDIAPKKLEVINRLLSPSVALDADNNTTAIAIIPDETSARETFARGWTHLFSIPRIWTLENGRINQQPHPSLKKLRLTQTNIPANTIYNSTNLLLCKGMQQVEIDVTIDPGKSGRFGFVVGKNDTGTEQSKIYFDLDKQQLIVDQTRSSLRKFMPLKIRTGDYKIEPGKKINIHLYIDGSVIEGFINNKDAFTTRLFPLNQDSNRVELFTGDNDIKLIEGETWSLKSSNNKTAF